MKKILIVEDQFIEANNLQMILEKKATRFVLLHGSTYCIGTGYYRKL